MKSIGSYANCSTTAKPSEWAAIDTDSTKTPAHTWPNGMP